MIPIEIKRMYDILVSFLGPSKSSLDETYSLEFNCPHCTEENGGRPDNKFNLSISMSKGVFQCWKCASGDNTSMKGSVLKLIKMYGSKELMKEYKQSLKELRDSSLYMIKFDGESFNLSKDPDDNEALSLPKYYQPFNKDKPYPEQALEYLSKRGIGWPIINKYALGFTTYHNDDKKLSNRIILPSFDSYGDLNYWTGRDFTGNKLRQKYYNPETVRMELIFNEINVQWDADINLVEGPFDHIVTPNSIPLLGKTLTPEYKIYQSLMEKANANVNIFIDGDAYSTAKKLYLLLNRGRLYNRIRVIQLPIELDPSQIFENWGSKGVISYINRAKQINEIELI